MPKISCITVCFNSADTIVDCLQSVYKQEYSNYEHIIIDGKSTDSTLKLIEEHSTSNTIVISSKDKGVYDAMNKGINASTGDIICFINSDDYYISSDVFNHLASYYNDRTSKILCASTVHESGYVWEPTIPSKKPLCYTQNPHPSLFIYNFQKIKNEIKFDIKFSICSDLYQQLKLIYKLNIPVLLSDRKLVFMRSGGLSNSGVSYIYSFIEGLTIYNTLFGSLGLIFTFQRIFKKFFFRYVK